MIKQVVPVPEYFSPMVYIEGEGYVDAISEGWSVFYALGEEDYVTFYVMDSTGDGDMDTFPVGLVPTRYCPKCGNRMVPRISNDSLSYGKCPVCEEAPR